MSAISAQHLGARLVLPSVVSHQTFCEPLAGKSSKDAGLEVCPRSAKLCEKVAGDDGFQANILDVETLSNCVCRCNPSTFANAKSLEGTSSLTVCLAKKGLYWSLFSFLI